MRLIKVTFATGRDLFEFLKQNSISRYIIDPSQRCIVIEDKSYTLPSNAIVITLQDEESELLTQEGNEMTG